MVEHYDSAHFGAQALSGTIAVDLTYLRPRGGGGSEFTFGVRAPNQTFNQCMVQHAQDYSIVGAVDLAAGAVAIDSNLSSYTAGQALGGNNINSLLFGSTSSVATTFAGQTPGLVSTAMGSSVTYGRRTADITSLNLAGKGGLPRALSQASAGVKSVLGTVGKALNLGLKTSARFAIDLGLTGAEAIGCSIPQ